MIHMIFGTKRNIDYQNLESYQQELEMARKAYDSIWETEYE